MTLTEQLRRAETEGRAKRDPERTAIMDRATAELAASGVAERSLAVGERAPDFTLPNAHGDDVTLAELLAEGPVVVSFYRGGWCAYCNLELRALQRALPRIEALGARLVAISPNLPDTTLSTGERNALEFALLSDVGNRVARAYGLVFTLAGELRPFYAGYDLPAVNGDASFELPLPATYVLDRGGVVLAAFVDADYTRRMDPDDIVAALEALPVVR